MRTVEGKKYLPLAAIMAASVMIMIMMVRMVEMGAAILINSKKSFSFQCEILKY